jgi:benzaldehyde dehydrogenase (NAD)
MQVGLVVMDEDPAGALKIVRAADQTLNNDAYAPFGGTGSSGNGSRFGSQSSWDEFTQWQWVTARSQAHGFPF